MEIYEKVTTCGKYEDLSMSSFYRKGSGLYAHLMPTKRHTNEHGYTIVECTITYGTTKEGGKFFFVKPMTRNSQKTRSALETYLNANKKELARMYDADDWNGIQGLLSRFN